MQPKTTIDKLWDIKFVKKNFVSQKKTYQWHNN